MDRYLQRSLKNWAAQQDPPERLRARLLLRAANQPQLPEGRYPSSLYIDRPEPENPFRLGGVGHARIADLIWSFHIPMPGLRMM
jgi:hypothetical protein